ncbi:hypothetical protein IVB38_34585 [Bradyrhizobium sp. 38]|uniref:hypothetical protein n=1 Tax=unclassified Bradyrhizobium TaxID=2631580 RepID=UPI001FF8BD75|nr:MULTISPECIES: hypothetical protein [unclassified Bradyrhizobium]MCK1341008.1 hypothetical protein [Bradyrhizobium sp. 38]MCK1780983.1 hypothetical protein [Bradyrhizobium sp. 132]
MPKPLNKLPDDQPGRLAAVGLALYGTAWRRRLAAGLSISRSTLYHWIQGERTERDVDGDLIDLLDRERDLAAARGADITALRRKLIDHGRRDARAV